MGPWLPGLQRGMPTVCSPLLTLCGRYIHSGSLDKTIRIWDARHQHIYGFTSNWVPKCMRKAQHEENRTRDSNTVGIDADL